MRDQNPFQVILGRFATRLKDAPGAARLARLARSAKNIPAPLIAELTSLVVQLDDVPLCGSDIFIHLIEIAFCDARCADATAFASALAKRLQGYIDSPIAANDARGDLRERSAWWSTAVARTAELRRWPALELLMEKM